MFTHPHTRCRIYSQTDSAFVLDGSGSSETVCAAVNQVHCPVTRRTTDHARKERRTVNVSYLDEHRPRLQIQSLEVLAKMTLAFWGKNNSNNSNNNNRIPRRYSRFFFFYNLVTAPRTVSNTYAQVARVQSCANHVQHIERLSRASVMLRATWYEGTAQQLSLTELKSHLFEFYFIG